MFSAQSTKSDRVNSPCKQAVSLSATIFGSNSLHKEIYNEKDELVEIHQKYPEDKGHQKIVEK